MAGSAGAIALVEIAVIVLASNSVAVSPRSEMFGAESVMGVVDIIMDDGPGNQLTSKY